MTFVRRGGVLPRHKPVLVPHGIGTGVFLETDDYRITAARAEHVQPYLESLAYRVDTDGGSVVITGDTRPCDSVTELARGADTLLMMCCESHARVSSTNHDLATFSTPGAAEPAAMAGCRPMLWVPTGGRRATP